MTNKLGSANPSRIPKPKKKVDKNTMLGEDLRQFNLDNTFNDILKNDRTLANRIDEIIRIKTKFTNTLNYFIKPFCKHYYCNLHDITPKKSGFRPFLSEGYNKKKPKI